MTVKLAVKFTIIIVALVAILITVLVVRNQSHGNVMAVAHFLGSAAVVVAIGDSFSECCSGGGWPLAIYSAPLKWRWPNSEQIPRRQSSQKENRLW